MYATWAVIYNHCARKPMRHSSSLQMRHPSPDSWVDNAIAIFICIATIAAPVIFGIFATPDYQLHLSRVVDLFSR
jgi:hypothetical protein